VGALAAAHGAPDDRLATVEELAPQIRRWIEEATFAPVAVDASVRLLDAAAARYGEFDRLVLVGLVEGEWPERPRRNIFYPPALLAELRLPSGKERRAAAASAFVDLLRSPSASVILSTFTLDDEALVERSSLVEEVPRAGLRVAIDDPPATGPLFPDEALALDPPALDAVDATAREWASFRLTRTSAADARYHGG